jgi:hypothetical protein
MRPLLLILTFEWASEESRRTKTFGGNGQANDFFVGAASLPWSDHASIICLCGRKQRKEQKQKKIIARKDTLMKYWYEDKNTKIPIHCIL